MQEIRLIKQEDFLSIKSIIFSLKADPCHGQSFAHYQCSPVVMLGDVFPWCSVSFSCFVVLFLLLAGHTNDITTWTRWQATLNGSTRPMRVGQMSRKTHHQLRHQSRARQPPWPVIRVWESGPIQVKKMFLEVAHSSFTAFVSTCQQSLFRLVRRAWRP